MEAASDFAFFVNMFFATSVAGTVLLVDGLLHASGRAPYLPLYGLSALVAYAAYSAALGAAERFGWADRALFDMHRLEVYERFGLRAPRDAIEETRAGNAISDKVLYRQPLPDELLRTASPEKVSSASSD